MRDSAITQPTPIDALRAIIEPGQITEIRVFRPDGRFTATWSGYYDDPETLLSDALELDRKGASGVYFIPNAVSRDLLARSEPNTCRMVGKRDPLTKDSEIERRRWFLLDIDPERAAGISSTDDEKERAFEILTRMADLLESEGMPEPIVADSGNGYHLVYPIDLSADDGGLVHDLTKALSRLFSTDEAHVDTAVSNASRIWKVYGTTARKGHSTEDRPHRRAEVLTLPEIGRRASEDDLRRVLAALTPEEPEKSDRPAHRANGRLSGSLIVGGGGDGPPLEEEIPHVLSFFDDRPDYQTWIAIIAGTLDRCGGNVSLARSYLKRRFPEEQEGEYEQKLAKPGSAKWAFVVHRAKERGYDPSAYYREWNREKRQARPKPMHTNGARPVDLADDPDESGKAPGGRPDNVTFTEALTEPTGERDSWWHTDFHHLATEGRFIFAPTGERWPGSSVDARLPWVEWTDDTGQTKAMAPTKLLMRHRTVEQLSWLPGAPQIVEDMLVSGGGRIPHKGAKIFNLYRPPTIITGSADKARPWRDHVHQLYPGEADHFFAWNAHRVQRPGEKINHALVLGGAPGIGKDCILEPIKMAVGPHNFEDVSPATVVARFNGFLRSVILRVSEARDMGDVDRYAFYEHMKTITAAPPDMLRIDEKHAREFYIPNVTGVIYTTNHKASGIYLPPDDRRHFVAWSEATQDDFSEEYFDRLWTWYESGGYSHVVAYLHEYDLSGFNPKAPPPKTQAFWEIVDAGRAPEDAELADALDLLEWPAAVTITDVADRASPAFQEWLSERRNRRKVPHRFEAAGYVPVRNDGAKDGLWKIGGKRQAVYALKTDSARDRIAAANALLERPTVPF